MNMFGLKVTEGICPPLLGRCANDGHIHLGLLGFGHKPWVTLDVEKKEDWRGGAKEQPAYAAKPGYAYNQNIWKIM